MKKTTFFLFVIMAITILSCSKSDESTQTLDSLGETEWVSVEFGDNYLIYFSKSTTQCSINQPIGRLYGTYSYTKPNAIMLFKNDDTPSSTTKLFKLNTNYAVTVNGNNLKVLINGKNMAFIRLIE